MKYRYIFLCNLIGWTTLSVLDWLSENGYDVPMDFNVWIIGYTAIVAIAYVLFAILHVKEHPKLKKIFNVSADWILTVVAFGVPITILIENDMWIIPQAHGGWEHFLNGIEYPLFGIFFGVVLLLVYWLYNGIVALYYYYVKKSKEGDK